MRSIKINGNRAIVSGASYCYRSSAAALATSRHATTDPGVVSYYDPASGRDVYLGAGEVSASDRSQSLYGRGGRHGALVTVVEVAS